MVLLVHNVTINTELVDKLFQRVSLYLKFHNIIMVYKESLVRNVGWIDQNLRAELSQNWTF